MNLNIFKNINQINELIEVSEKIAIVIHVNPDGDALGAGLALYHYLLAKQKKVNIVSPNLYPSFLGWMPCAERIVVHSKNKEKAETILKESELIFCLDFNASHRVEKLQSALVNATCKKVLIDHHLSPEAFTDLVVSDVQTSSTSELLYECIIAMEGGAFLNKVIAECLYVGIVTDTGSFSYACNHKRTYEIIAELYDLGIDGEQIHRLIYDTYSLNRMQLLGYCLSQKMKVFIEYATAYIYLSKDDLKKFNYQIGDTEGVVNYALAVEGIKMAALIVEHHDHVKISLRSKGSFSVDKLARDHFEGGGHRNAAGGNQKMPFIDVLTKFENLLPFYKEELNANI